jgi:glycosyltransferase involved in cell wall biosynthesis
LKKLTIITINYNDARGLKKTIESIVSQTCKNFEYLIIDGGSKDGSLEFINKNLDEIDYWVSESDKGIYNAMNKGIKKASGDYVLFINSGDTLVSEKVIENALEYLFDEDIISFNINYLKDDITTLRRPPKVINFSYFYKNSLPHPSTFIKRSLFNEVGYFDETLKIASDWKFYILALFKYNASYKNVNQLVANFNLDGISSTQSSDDELQMVLQKNFSRFINDYNELNHYKQFSHSYTYLAAKKLHKYWIFRKGFRVIHIFLK